MKTAGNGSGPDPRTKRYLEGLLEGDDDVAYAAVKTMLAEEASVADVYLKLLTPAMVRVGELWRKRKINVGQQKLATEITLRQMERLRSIIGTKPKSLHRALVSCVQGEQHSTGAEMAADLFRLEGWSVDFLGADLPTDDLLMMVKNRQPQILALSVTMKQNLRHLRRLLEALSKLAARPNVLIGGQATGTLARWKVGNLDFNVAANLMDGPEFCSNGAAFDVAEGRLGAISERDRFAHTPVAYPGRTDAGAVGRSGKFEPGLYCFSGARQTEHQHGRRHQNCQCLRRNHRAALADMITTNLRIAKRSCSLSPWRKTSDGRRSAPEGESRACTL